jgi:Na+/H+-translocating membrane pyrophosphatase
MHRNEKKLVSDLSAVAGLNIYTLARDVFDIAGFSKEFVVRSITKDGTISFGSSNMLHWSVVKGWVLDPTNDYIFSGKVLAALENSAHDIVEEANA